MDTTVPTATDGYAYGLSSLVSAVRANLGVKESCGGTAQKMKFSIKNFISKCDQIRRKIWISSHPLNKSLMENFIFCAVELFVITGKYFENSWHCQFIKVHEV